MRDGPKSRPGGATQQVGDVLQLGAGRGVGVHLHRAALAHGRQRAVPPYRLGRQPGQRDVLTTERRIVAVSAGSPLADAARVGVRIADV
ncbi:hypothetical protein ACFU7U_06185, partial [Streptomyces celluloflavus]